MVTLTQDQPVKTPVRFRVQLRPEATKLVVDFKDSQLDLLRQVLNFLGTQNQEANMESMQHTTRHEGKPSPS